MKRLAALAVLAALALPTGCAAQQTAPRNDLDESPADRDARMAWWREARFGMFIHWGVYAVPAGFYQGESVKGIGEWIMHKAKIPVPEYEKFAARFNPVRYDPDAWVRLAKDAGMRYIVITSKHHDGFCLWDSKVSDWDVVDRTPYAKDLLRPLAEACRRHGLRLCFYHSIMDWHHPDAHGERFPAYRDQYLKPQLNELVTGYGPLGVLWFDGEWINEWTAGQGADLYNYVRALQPDIIINNRVGKGRKGMEGTNKPGRHAGDFGTPEQRIPPTGLPGVDWETCMTMNRTWGYRSDDDNWKSTETLVRNLVDIASKGGNYLLNVGPTAEGLIPETSVQRLREIGNWMRTNGEAVYGTDASPFGAPDWGRYTRKPGRLYAHVFAWPDDARLRVPLPASAAAKACLLADPQRKALRVEPAEGTVVIHLPAQAPDPVASVVAIDLAEGASLPRPPEPEKDQPNP